MAPAVPPTRLEAIGTPSLWSLKQRSGRRCPCCKRLSKGADRSIARAGTGSTGVGVSQTHLGGFATPGRSDLKRSSPIRSGLAATGGRGVCFPFIGNVFKASAARQWPVGAGAGSGAGVHARQRRDTDRRPTVQQAPARACGQGSRPHGDGRGHVACQAEERRWESWGRRGERPAVPVAPAGKKPPIAKRKGASEERERSWRRAPE